MEGNEKARASCRSFWWFLKNVYKVWQLTLPLHNVSHTCDSIYNYFNFHFKLLKLFGSVPKQKSPEMLSSKVQHVLHITETGTHINKWLIWDIFLWGWQYTGWHTDALTGQWTAVQVSLQFVKLWWNSICRISGHEHSCPCRGIHQGYILSLFHEQIFLNSKLKSQSFPELKQSAFVA